MENKALGESNPRHDFREKRKLLLCRIEGSETHLFIARNRRLGGGGKGGDPKNDLRLSKAGDQRRSAKLLVFKKGSNSKI